MEEFETLFIWLLGFYLSSMVKHISSYAAASIALGFKRGTQSLLHEKAVSPGDSNFILIAVRT
jgi:hypothetical protein